MRTGLVCLAICLLCPLGAFAQIDYDRHVIFDNSLPDGGYDASESEIIPPSTLETDHGRFPVETAHFVSPPNALRLKWLSAPGGDWRMVLTIHRRYARHFRFAGDMLTFWCFSDSEITAANSPLMFLRDADKNGTPAIRIVDGDARIPAGKWVLVKLPLAAFRNDLYNGTDDIRFDPVTLESIWFMQGLDDNRPHTLYLDDFQVRSLTPADTTAPPPPAGVAVRGSERHLDVTWQPSPAPDLLAYRIYRSRDGRSFAPVGTQQGLRTRWVDFCRDRRASGILSGDRARSAGQ